MQYEHEFISKITLDRKSFRKRNVLYTKNFSVEKVTVRFRRKGKKF